ncbi:MAG: hypothetical protein JXR68_09240 [Bacteroidales bacterium]|nr:hypothetical protein [Bacteroidales bacterium]
MKKINFFSILVLLLLFSFSSFAQRNFKQTLTINAGSYLINTVDLYFFDDGINCYLLNECNDIDTVFEGNAKNLVVTKDSIIKYQAYLFTDTYEYVYTKIGKNEGWLRVEIPMPSNQKDFIKSMLLTLNYEDFSSYVEVIPFKKPHQVFISTTDFWYIADLTRLKSTQIGSKGGRLEACQMIFPKNCVKCYIDLGWGQEVFYDSKGNKKKIR